MCIRDSIKDYMDFDPYLGRVTENSAVQAQQQEQQAQQPQQAQVTDPAGNPAGGMAANTVMNRQTGGSG